MTRRAPRRPRLGEALLAVTLSAANGFGQAEEPTPAPAASETAFPPAAAESMAHALTAWIEAVEDGGADRVTEAGGRVQAAYDALRDACGHDPLRDLEAWSALLERARRHPPAQAGSFAERRSLRLGQPYGLQVPALAGDAPLPLLVVLGGDATPAALVGALPASFRDRFLVLALDFDGLPADRLAEDGRRGLVDALAETFRAHEVDRDRILLLGRDQGAPQAEIMAALLPHFFAGLALLPATARSGSVEGTVDPPALPSPGVLRDLLAQSRLQQLVPVQSCAALDEALGWLDALPAREAYPLSFAASPLVPGAARFCWVQVREEFEPIGAGTGPAWLAVAVDREENRIDLRARGVHRVDLYLNDRIVDLDRPILVRHLGEDRVYRFEAERSLATLLENFARNPDPRALFPAMIRGIDLPPAARR